MEKDLNYWKKNAEEDYMKTPISVLRYISKLEKVALPQTNSESVCPKCKFEPMVKVDGMYNCDMCDYIGTYSITNKNKMNADLVGALWQLDTSWRAFEHKGKPMTKEQVRKALVYGIKKGYTHTGQMTDDDVDAALIQKN